MSFTVRLGDKRNRKSDQMKGLSVEDKPKLGINLSSELQDILVLYEHHDTGVHHFVLSEKRYMYQKENMKVKAFYWVS